MVRSAPRVTRVSRDAWDLNRGASHAWACREGWDDTTKSGGFAAIRCDRGSRPWGASTGDAAGTDLRGEGKPFRPYHALLVPRGEKLGATVDRRLADAHGFSEATCDGIDHITTIMLRNIPNKYVQSALMAEIDKEGFQDTYDFFYLPMDVHNRSNVGYAFINFVRREFATRFAKVFDEYVFKDIVSAKMASVSPAHIQGLIENLRHFSKRAVTISRKREYRPVAKYQGRTWDIRQLLAELTSESEFHKPEPRAIVDNQEILATGLSNPLHQIKVHEFTRPERDLPAEPPGLFQCGLLGRASLKVSSMEAACGPSTQRLGTKCGSPPGLSGDCTGFATNLFTMPVVHNREMWDGISFGDVKPQGELATGTAEAAPKAERTSIYDQPCGGSLVTAPFTAAKQGLQDAVLKMLRESQGQGMLGARSPPFENIHASNHNKIAGRCVYA